MLKNVSNFSKKNYSTSISMMEETRYRSLQVPEQLLAMYRWTKCNGTLNSKLTIKLKISSLLQKNLVLNGHNSIGMSAHNSDSDTNDNDHFHSLHGRALPSQPQICKVQGKVDLTVSHLPCYLGGNEEICHSFWQHILIDKYQAKFV